jgi:transcription-repair coupling factor (superfamily II helicase)
MDGDKLEKSMMKFVEGEYDILVSTNIIEAGLDIPNANTIIINHSHLFGLSDLHQMRGRVGRSNRKAFCYLLTPGLSMLTTESRKRLQALEEFSELGDGFKVAMRDLDIRGAGNLLGAEQSGFVTDLGFEMYHKILDEAVQELKENEFKALFENDVEKVASILKIDCQIETDKAVMIPEYYVSNISERLGLYNRLDNIANEEELTAFRSEIIDRFGQLPPEVKDLINIVQARQKAERIGFEKLNLKANVLKGQFVSVDKEAYYQSNKFGKILDYVKMNSKRCVLKDQKNKLTLSFENIYSIKQMSHILDEILETFDPVE